MFPSPGRSKHLRANSTESILITCDGKGLVARARLLLFDCTVLSLGTLEDWDAAFSRCRVQLLRVNERRQKVIVRSVLLA